MSTGNSNANHRAVHSVCRSISLALSHSRARSQRYDAALHCASLSPIAEIHPFRNPFPTLMHFEYHLEQLPRFMEHFCVPRWNSLIKCRYARREIMENKMNYH